MATDRFIHIAAARPQPSPTLIAFAHLVLGLGDILRNLFVIGLCIAGVAGVGWLICMAIAAAGGLR